MQASTVMFDDQDAFPAGLSTPLSRTRAVIRGFVQMLRADGVDPGAIEAMLATALAEELAKVRPADFERSLALALDHVEQLACTRHAQGGQGG